MTVASHLPVEQVRVLETAGAVSAVGGSMAYPVLHWMASVPASLTVVVVVSLLLLTAVCEQV